MTKNILIAGVGGQGTVLASRVLGKLAADAGWDVKVSEVHGMARRGGSVLTYVRFGEEVASPLIEAGQADALLAFESLEALRYLHCVKPGGAVIASAQRILPMAVIAGKEAYPEDIEARLSASGCKVTLVDALSLAREAGMARAANSVLIGVLSGAMEDLPEESFLAALRACVPPATVAANEAAFLAGRKLTVGR